MVCSADRSLDAACSAKPLSLLGHGDRGFGAGVLIAPSSCLLPVIACSMVLYVGNVMACVTRYGHLIGQRTFGEV